jgi:hypothetical protein
MTIHKLALFVFLKLDGLCGEISLSSQSCEAGKRLLLQVCILQLKEGQVFEFHEAMHDKDHILEHVLDP